MGLRDEAWRQDPSRYPLRFALQTRYGDMDSNAHLNNVAIARLVEESRVRLHHAIHAAGGAVSPGGVMIVHVGIDYLGEGEYPADVEACAGIASVGGSSYRIAVALRQKARAFVLAESVMVHVGAGRAGPVPVAPALRALLEQFRVRPAD